MIGDDSGEKSPSARRACCPTIKKTQPAVLVTDVQIIANALETLGEEEKKANSDPRGRRRYYY
jgi:hypothetical protein